MQTRGKMQTGDYRQCKILLEILPRFSASFLLPRFWDLAAILVRMSTRFRDLSENFNKLLAPKILRSCQDLSENLNEILRSLRDSWRVFGHCDFEISARISTRLWDHTEFLAAEISRSKFCRGGNMLGSRPK